MESLKLAYCAGHYINTPGKRVPSNMGLGDIREWTINDQVADFFPEAAAHYEGFELLRTDDPTGEVFIDIPERVAKANAWKADLYLDLHHNAGIDGGSGGGVMAFHHPNSEKGKKYATEIYNSVIAAGGLKGNRAEPIQGKAFESLVLTDMPAVLMEYGFMDSKVDAPVIVTKAYSKLCAYATIDAIAKAAGLQRKQGSEEKSNPEHLYRIRKDWDDAGSQKGAYVNLELAKAACPEGYSVYNWTGDCVYYNGGDEFVTETYSAEEFVRDVQKAIGAKVDGIPGPETLGKTPTISADKNSTHPAVEAIQKRLYTLGYVEVGTADGIAGTKFDQAVKAFQQDNDCVVDGELTAGNKTWRCILGME